MHNPTTPLPIQLHIINVLDAFACFVGELEELPLFARLHRPLYNEPVVHEFVFRVVPLPTAREHLVVPLG